MSLFLLFSFAGVNVNMFVCMCSCLLSCALLFVYVCLNSIQRAAAADQFMLVRLYVSCEVVGLGCLARRADRFGFFLSVFVVVVLSYFFSSSSSRFKLSCVWYFTGFSYAFKFAASTFLQNDRCCIFVILPFSLFLFNC